MATVKPARKRKNVKSKRAISRIATNGTRPARARKRVRISGGTGRVPKDILETPGPACPGAVEILIADRNR